MGLFSGSKKVYVSSSVYNLAGDEIDRPNFLKSSLFGAIMNKSNPYMGETITRDYLTGPGIMQRSFFNYVVRNNYVGLPRQDVTNSTKIDPVLVEGYVPTPSGQTTRIIVAEITDGDYTPWARQLILRDFPERINTNWVADYDRIAHKITIQWEDGSTILFTPLGYTKDDKFIVIEFEQYIGEEDQSVVVGTTNQDVDPVVVPDGYVQDLVTQTPEVFYLLDKSDYVVREYSNGDPTTDDIVDYQEEESYIGTDTQYFLNEYSGSSPNDSHTTNTNKWFHVIERREIAPAPSVTTTKTETLGDGSTVTITTTTTGDQLVPSFDTRLDTQEIHNNKVITKGVWMYRVGSGRPELDALITQGLQQQVPDYYPFIPLRLNNLSIREPQFASVYEASKKAYKRATGGPLKGQSLDAVLDKVEENVDIGDIDYSYIQWGVSVNVKDIACRRYMYEWFSNQRMYQNSTPSSVSTYEASVSKYVFDAFHYDQWQKAQYDDANILYGKPAPPRPTIEYPPATTVRLNVTNPQLTAFDNRFTWLHINEENFTGLGRAGAVQGDIFWSVGTAIGEGGTQTIVDYSAIRLNRMFLYRQNTPNSYSRLEIIGMVHENYIYGGKNVRTTLEEGVKDPQESVFIIPLHAETVAALGIRDFTQMTLSNTFITFNSYQVVKKRWYQSFLGMLLIVIAIVVISALISPAAVGSLTGAFGTNAAVGASLGLSGTTAIVAGAVTNAIAAIVITQAITTISTEVFGEKWGAIIGTIVSFAVNFGISSGFGNLTTTSMLNPETILKFSDALANGYSGFVQGEIAEITTDMEENQNEYDKASSDIEDLMRSMGLTNDLMFDQLSLTDFRKGNGSTSTGSYVPETVDQFIGRTTMLGSDVVDITLSMVSNYSGLQLTLPTT